MRFDDITALIASPERAGSLAARARARRWLNLLARFPRLEEMTVLDLGGTAAAWRLAGMHPARLLFVNVIDPGDVEGAEHLIADACDPPEALTRQHFDLVYSNSVIEHVGGHWRRQRFAESVRSLGDHYFVQTPYRYFPLEPHFLGPMFQFLPLNLRAKAVATWPIGSAAGEKDPVALEQRLQDTEVLDRTQMRHYFPDGDLVTERVLGIPKSLVSVR